MITTTRNTKRLMALTCLLFLGLIVVAVGQASAAPAGFAYMKEHTITGSSDGDLTNYCINITVYNTTGEDSGLNCYLGNHIEQSLFEDIRVYDPTGTIEFPIWAEPTSYTANSVRIWINITDTIPQNTNYRLNIYYGNAAAANVFNGSLTFPFFDDFSGAALNTTGKDKWNTVGAGGTISVSNGILTVNGSASQSCRVSNEKLSPPMEVHGYVQINETGSASDVFGAGSALNTFVGVKYTSSKYWGIMSSGSGPTLARTPAYSDAFHRLTVNVNNTKYVKFYTDDTLSLQTTSTSTPQVALGAFWQVYYVGSWIKVDWCFIKNSTNNEPTHSTYSDEMTTPTAGFTSDTQNGGEPLTVQFTDASTGGGLSYSWSFGDDETSTDASPSHVYNSAGVYTVSLTVSNLLGTDAHTETDYITVIVSPPTITGITGTPTSGYNPLTVSFTATTTGSGIYSYYWTFGDGMTSTAITPTHVYKPDTIGTYTVSLTVTNSGGSDTYTATDYITVTWHTTGNRPLVSPGATKAPFSMDAYNKSLFGIFGGGNWDNVTPEGIVDGFVDPYVDALGPMAIIIIVASLALVLYIKTESTVLPGVITIADGGLLLWMFPYDWQFMGYGLVIIGFVATAWGLFVRRGS